MKIVSSEGYCLKGDDQRYPSSHDANIRLSKTIVRWEGRPVYVKGIYSETLISIWGMRPESDDFVVDSNDIRLDVSSPRLGFFEYAGTAYYAMRTPIRSQRQGIDPPRLVYYDIKRGEMRSFSIDTDVLYAFRRTLEGEYRSLEEGLRSEGTSFALSKTWALRRTSSKSHFIVYHKTDAVGFFNPAKRVFKLQKGRANRLRLASLTDVISKQYGAHYDISF